MREAIKSTLILFLVIGVLLLFSMVYELRKEFNELKQSNSDFKNEVAVDVWKK